MAKTKKLFDYNAPFPTRFRSLIEEKGVTLDVLAVKFNTTRQTISNWMNGATVPDAVSICEIARYFGVTTDYLLGLTDVRTVETDVRAVAEYTGLSENAVNILHKRTTFVKEKNTDSYPEEMNEIAESEKVQCRNENMIVSKMIADRMIFELSELIIEEIMYSRISEKQKELLGTKENVREIIEHRNDDEYLKKIMAVFYFERLGNKEFFFTIDSKWNCSINIDCSKIGQLDFMLFKTINKQFSDISFIRNLVTLKAKPIENISYKKYECSRILDRFAEKLINPRLNDDKTFEQNLHMEEILRDVDRNFEGRVNHNGTNKEAD